MRDDSQKHGAGPCGCVRPCGKLGLAQVQLLPHGPYVNRGGAIDLHLGEAHAWRVLASGIGEGLVEAGLRRAYAIQVSVSSVQVVNNLVSASARHRPIDSSWPSVGDSSVPHARPVVRRIIWEA
jgi:hypothetical protein